MADTGYDADLQHQSAHLAEQAKSHHAKEQADRETLERWQAYKENGETISNEAMMDWLDSWGFEQGRA